MKLVMVLLFLITFSVSSKEIAISFDDSPTGSSNFQRGLERTKKLIKALGDAKVEETIFFCNSKKIVNDDEDKKRLLLFAKAGHVLANHTHTHPNLHKVSKEYFLKDMKKADKLLSPLPNFKKYFRFPYLNNGKTEEQRSFVINEINKMGYQHGYVTVDNYDWYLDSLFRKAYRENKKINYKKLKSFYVKYMIDSVNFYDEMAIKVLGRSPRHVLLLHENDLASMYIKDLVLGLKKEGWKIISPNEAYLDPISKEEPNIALGQGRITRIAKSEGYTGELRHELEVIENWNGLLEKLGIIK